MKFQCALAAAEIVAISTGAAIVLVSCATSGPLAAPLQIPGAHFVGNQACADCHAEILQRFPASPHAHLVVENANAPGGIGCESCHGPGSKHIASADPDSIINPGKNPGACFRCHLQVQAEFQLPEHHPVIEGEMNCAQCHDPHGGDIFKTTGGLAMARMNETCARCHREQTRPFVFEHPAMREGCPTCHTPHGSINRMLLTQADDNLCLRCHAQVQGVGVAPGEIYIGNSDHTAYLQIGTCWSAGCHTAIHGSDIDPRLRY